MGGRERSRLFRAACDFSLLVDKMLVIVWARAIVVARVFLLALEVVTLSD